MSILTHLSLETPVSINALQKASGLSATQLTLALVEAGGKVKAVEGGLVLAPEPTAAPKQTGPRGSIARTAPRHEVARRTLLSLAGLPGGCNALTVLEAAAGGCNYADIIMVARKFVADGTVVETKKGRKCTWTLPAAE